MNNQPPQPNAFKMIRTRDASFGWGLDKLKQVNELAASGRSPLEVLKKMAQSPTEDALDRWVTADPPMLAVKEKIRRLKDSDTRSPVLIVGPTGTGKELLARALKIHDSPFLAINCGGQPETLFESIFFGYKRGAFTGAVTDTKGVLEAAKDGIVFLDEIGDMAPSLQSKLLRAIQEQEIYPVGAVDPVRIHCQFIAATKHDLRTLVESHQFREDLFARLYTHELMITGLQHRPNDIPLIAKHLHWENPIPEQVLPDIYRFNVRAIQAYIERMKTYGQY